MSSIVILAELSDSGRIAGTLQLELWRLCTIGTGKEGRRQARPVASLAAESRRGAVSHLLLLKSVIAVCQRAGHGVTFTADYELHRAGRGRIGRHPSCPPDQPTTSPDNQTTSSDNLRQPVQKRRAERTGSSAIIYLPER